MRYRAPCQSNPDLQSSTYYICSFQRTLLAGIRGDRSTITPSALVTDGPGLPGAIPSSSGSASDDVGSWAVPPRRVLRLPACCVSSGEDTILQLWTLRSPASVFPAEPECRRASLPSVRSQDITSDHCCWPRWPAFHDKTRSACVARPARARGV